MNWKTFLQELHISAPALLSGMAGGSILMLKYREVSIRRAAALVLASGAASNYLTELITKWLDMNGMSGAVGFVIGLLFILIFDVVANVMKLAASNPKFILELLVDLIPFKNRTNKRNEIEKNDDGGSSTEFGGDWNEPGKKP